MRTKLILIGGVPGTGKTTIAYNLALHLKIDKVVSTDMIKIFAKAYLPNYDKYLYTTTHEAYKLDNLSIIDGYLRHSSNINDLILKIIENIKDNIIIIEGSTINNEFIKKIDKKKYQLLYFNLSLSMEELTRRYKQKEKIRKSNWIENITTIEEIDKYLCTNNFNIINENIDLTMERVIKYVKKNLCI